MPQQDEDGACMVSGEAIVAPYTDGVEPPGFPLPSGATDTHHHVFDPRYPEHQGMHPLPAQYQATPPSVEAYRRFKRRLGITRSILVAPSNYGDDNTLVLDAIKTMGQDNARGVAIVKPTASDAGLDRLHDAGIRGIRLYMGPGRAPTLTDLRAFASRAHERDWHLQLVGDRKHEVFAEYVSVLLELPCRLVIDHFGYAPQPDGQNSATAGAIRRLLAQGKTYVKLSGVYIQSKSGFPDYADMDGLASELISTAPDRMLWGSDWPHVGTAGRYPNGARLVEQLGRWAPSAQLRRRILVENPDQLYWAS